MFPRENRGKVIPENGESVFPIASRDEREFTCLSFDPAIPSFATSSEKSPGNVVPEYGQPVAPIASGDDEEFTFLNEIDPALQAKMHLVNNAIDEIGFTTFHVKLFCLNGFGYAVDSFLEVLLGSTAGVVGLEFQPSYIYGGQIALYVGLMIGALFWGISADIIGRRWAFNISLFSASIFSIVAGASPNYSAWAIFVALSGFGAGGNLILDTTVFLEYVPSQQLWMLPLMAVWWGLGQIMASLLSWAFLPNFSCDAAGPCTRANNMGWRYLFFTGGALALVMSALRVAVIRFSETPKYLVCNGKDKEAVAVLQEIAHKYNRQSNLTLAHLEHCGPLTSTHSKNRFSFDELIVHHRGLFVSRKLALSTCLVWFSWALVGFIYPLYYVFLPGYLASRGAELGESSVSVVYRDFIIVQVCSMIGPVIAGALCRMPRVGQKRTMAFGALITMAFFFAYTAIRTEAQNFGFSCAIAVGVNIYYGTLYAYAPTVMPSAHRATGNGTAVAINRIMGIMTVIVATFAHTPTSAPIFICAAFFGVAALIALSFPFEPLYKRPS